LLVGPSLAALQRTCCAQGHVCEEWLYRTSIVDSTCGQKSSQENPDIINPLRLYSEQGLCGGEQRAKNLVEW
jgi:hypothetical protein